MKSVSCPIYIKRLALAQLQQWQTLGSAVQGRELKLLKMLLSSDKCLCNAAFRLWR